MLNFNPLRRWRLRRLLKQGAKLSRSTQASDQLKAYENYIASLEYTKDIIYMDKSGALTALYHSLTFTLDTPYQSSTDLLNDTSRMLELMINDVAIRKDSIVQLDKKITIPLNDFLMFANRFSLLVFIETSISIFKKYHQFIETQVQTTQEFTHFEYNHRMVKRRLDVLWFVCALILSTCARAELYIHQEEGEAHDRSE